MVYNVIRSHQRRRNETRSNGRTAHPLPVIAIVCAALVSSLFLLDSYCCLLTQAKVTGTTPDATDSKKRYQEKKKELQSADAALRFDANIRLNAQEKRLDKHLLSLRRALLAKYKKEKRFPPSEPFFAVKEEIKQTPLFHFLRGMPKGGLLHIHTSSTAPSEWVVTEGIREPNCYVCWPKDRGKTIKGQLGFFRPGQVPDGYQAAADLIRQDPTWPKKLQKLITINVDDAELTNLEIRTKFDQVFQRMGGLVSFQPIFEKYYTAAFRTLLDDNIFYVEMRTGFGQLYDLAGKRYDYKRKTALLWKVRNEVRKQNPHFELKLIYSGYRRGAKKQVWTQLTEAVELRKSWSAHNFVVGFDLVGQEDAGYATEFYLPDWIKLQRYLKERKATLPLYFHDGESDWPSDENLYDAYLLGCKRVGHGFNLFRFPALEQRLKKHGVALEVCPISNQMLGLVDDLRIHPASGYLRRGVPCVLGNDDPGILGNNGLSYDFWEATMAWGLDLAALKQLAINSLQYSSMTDAEKKAAVAHWESEWQRWVDQSVKEIP